MISSAKKKIITMSSHVVRYFNYDASAEQTEKELSERLKRYSAKCYMQSDIKQTSIFYELVSKCTFHNFFKLK